MQATVQATLANLPMDQVQSAYKPTDPGYAENMRWAEEALVTAVFCIIICGAWGTLSIRYLAPFLLEKVWAAPQRKHGQNSLCACPKILQHGTGEFQVGCTMYS